MNAKPTEESTFDPEPQGAPASWLERWTDRMSTDPRWSHPALRWVWIAVAGMLWLLGICVPLDQAGQLLFGAGTFFAALLLRRITGRLTTLAMIVLSVTASSRYIYWRLTNTLGFDNWLDAFFGFGLMAGEIYAFTVLLMGFFQTAWPLKRQPAAMPKNTSAWPSVDIFIPTYNEPLDVVRQTVMAALQLDWPADKRHVYVLDDGRRPEFKAFCQSLGVGYLERDNNRHAKAGNINEALAKTHSEYVAIFDCDHIPVRSFLQVCMGWFLRDPTLAMLQTPHVFFSPDPFEKNLDTFRRMPNEGDLFYGIVQDGNDLWNASFFCGSCAVIKRGPLLEVGGVAVETVTEDAHTALKLSRKGYSTAYLQIPQAAGLATESLSSHIGQRIRWARGMAQIARLDNPLLGKGLKLGQRLCYLNAMLHFFYGLPRLVFLTAPLAYLLFGAQVFHATALLIVAYALPHLAHASITNSRIQGKFRHSFWNEVYESVLAWYIMRPVLTAFINPSAGKFNVTAKGGTIDQGFFDLHIARPYLILLALNIMGFVVGIARIVWQPHAQIDTLLINMVWTTYNVILTSASLAVANETRQVRSTPRVDAQRPATLYLENGHTIACQTQDFSQHGLSLLLPPGMHIAAQTPVSVALFRGQEECVLPAVVSSQSDGRVGLRLVDLSLEQQQQLTAMTFSRGDAWLHRWTQTQRDRPLRSLGNVISTGLRGMSKLPHNLSNTLFRRAKAHAASDPSSH